MSPHQHLCLDDVVSLQKQELYGLEEVDGPFVADVLQDDAQGDEYPRPTDSAAAAVDGDWSVLSELRLRLVDLADEVDEALARRRHSLLRPIGELELTERSRLAVLVYGKRRPCTAGRAVAKGGQGEGICLRAPR